MRVKDSGSITIEALLLVPAMFLFASLIIYVGRMTDASIALHHAADVSARVASQSSAKDAVARATQTAKRELGESVSGCVDSTVVVTPRNANGGTTYVVRLTCAVNIQGLGILSLVKKTISVESSEIVDVYTNR